MRFLLAAVLLLPASPGFLSTVWLDSLDLTLARQGYGTPQGNVSVEGKPLTIAGRKFERGWGTHSPSKLVLELNQGSSRFTASVGIDDEIPPGSEGGTAVFEVVGDDKTLWTSGLVRRGELREVNVDVRSIRRLELYVTDGGDGTAYDHADWVDARFEVTGQAPVVRSWQKEGVMWHGSKNREAEDSYVAFRGRFELSQAEEIEIESLGSSWYVIWLDEQYTTEGPARFLAQHPEHQTHRVRLPAGNHLLAVQVHHIGLNTRLLQNMPPFLYCVVKAGGREIPVSWTCQPLKGYARKVRRINPQLGWIEWCDTNQNPAGWQSVTFDDRGWKAPEQAQTPLGRMRPVTISPVRHFAHELKACAEGPVAEVFGYERDDISVRFFLRDLECKTLPSQGKWRRYDLGRVRLGRPRFVLDLPQGAVVEFAYSETLSHDRVSPFIPFSLGPTCNMDHYVARGGVQEFFPLTPKGARFMEVHVFAPGEIRFVKEEFIERGYHDKPVGSFSCGDELLERIWMTGIETYRACTEDAITDNPTRERGQWTGDVVQVGADIGSVGYSDLKLCRRALVQAAQCARSDGMVACLDPGGVEYLPALSLQWVNSCLHYVKLTGDRTILEELYSAAVRNIEAFQRRMTKDGLGEGMGYLWIDWGYARNAGPVDYAYNLEFLSAVRAMISWAEALGRVDDATAFTKLEEKLVSILKAWLRGNDWATIGYHAATLALMLDLVQPEDRAACLGSIKRHWSRCFPSRRDAPRLHDPRFSSRELITPYFAHYSFPLLIEGGEMDFVLEQYRQCWGWMLEEGRTTWMEVFDSRWSHCHQWAGCPTWQLSRYVLGLHPRFDWGIGHYALKLCPGSLPKAEGTMPLASGDGVIRISWKRGVNGIQFHLETDRPIWLHVSEKETIKIDKAYDALLPVK